MMNCQKCGQPIKLGAKFCDTCGTPVPQAGLSKSETDALKYVVPIGRTPLSLFAGYFALFAPLILPAPLVLIVGIWTLRNLKKHPGKLGRGRAIFAIVMGGVFTAALLIGVILVNLHIGQK